MSRVNIIALAVLVAIVVWMLTWGDEAIQGWHRTALSAASPLIKTRHNVGQQAQKFSQAKTPRKELEDQIRTLTEEVRQLRIENDRVERLFQENARLRQMLTLKKIPSFELVAAEVIRRDTATWYHTIVINKGTDHGLKENDAVVIDPGMSLVGKISLAAEKTATVLLLTDEACKVTARVMGTDHSGIIQGQGNRSAGDGKAVMMGQGTVVGERGGINNQPTLRLRYLDKTSPIAANMDVISSGQGRVFPSNLKLGRIKSVHPGEITTEAEVVPSVDFSNLDFVFVIVGKQ